MKVNHIVDEKIIQKFYQTSTAGLKVRLVDGSGSNRIPTGEVAERFQSQKKLYQYYLLSLEVLK